GRPRGLEGVFLLYRCEVVLAGAATAERAPVPHNFPLEIDAFATLFANNPLAFESRELLRRDLYLHILHIEEFGLAHLAVGQHLLLILALDLRMHFARQRLRRLTGGDANCPSAFEINERSCELAPVAEF